MQQVKGSSLHSSLWKSPATQTSRVAICSTFLKTAKSLILGTKHLKTHSIRRNGNLESNAMNGWTFTSLLVSPGRAARVDLVQTQSMSEIACFRQLRTVPASPRIRLRTQAGQCFDTVRLTTRRTLAVPTLRCPQVPLYSLSIFSHVAKPVIASPTVR